VNTQSATEEDMTDRLRSALLGVTALWALAAAPAYACESTIADASVIKAGYITYVANPTVPPYQFTDSSGVLKGLRVDLANELSKRLCMESEFISAEFAVHIPGLEADRWDVTIAPIFYTEERAKRIYMIPYEQQALSISTKIGDGNIQSRDDLSGKSIAVEIGGFEEARLRDLHAEFEAAGRKGINIQTFDNYATSFQALRSGQVDAVAAMDAVGFDYQERGEFTRVLSGLFATPASLAFGDKALAEVVVEELNEMRADGSLGELYKPYGIELLPGEFLLKGPDIN